MTKISGDDLFMPQDKVDAENLYPYARILRKAIADQNITNDQFLDSGYQALKDKNPNLDRKRIFMMLTNLRGFAVYEKNLTSNMFRNILTYLGFTILEQSLDPAPLRVLLRYKDGENKTYSA